MRTVTAKHPTGECVESATPGQSALTALRESVAELRLRIRAALAQPERSEDFSYGRSPVVRVFDPTIRPEKSLSADRDVGRRQEEILKLLRERGPFRLIGALGSPALAKQLAVLNESHPNFRAATDFLLQEEVLARHRGTGVCGVKLLLHGAPGVGKTDYALRIAEILGLPSEVIGMSSAQASGSLGGSETYWSNTKPGQVFEAIVVGRPDEPPVANPLFVLDELEKSGRDGGDALGALFQLLEETSARVFTDKSVPWLPIDTSYTNWIATANDISTVHPAILSRFTLIEPAPLTREQRCAIAQRLYTDMLIQFDLQNRLHEELDEQMLDQLKRGSVRDTKRALRQSIAQALYQGEHRVRIPDQCIYQKKNAPVGFIGER